MRPSSQPWTLIPAEEIALNDWHAEVLEHAGRYHDLADVDPEAADDELFKMAYLLVERQEWREARVRREREEADRQAEHPREACGVVETGDCR